MRRPDGGGFTPTRIRRLAQFQDASISRFGRYFEAFCCCQILKRSTRADCKSAGFGLRWSESTSGNHFPGDWPSLVGRLPWEQEVGGSIPPSPTICVVVCIAWLLRLIVVQETAGSNPARRPRFARFRRGKKEGEKPEIPR
jgi:hypothetical protein